MNIIWMKQWAGKVPWINLFIFGSLWWMCYFLNVKTFLCSGENTCIYKQHSLSLDNQHRKRPWMSNSAVILRESPKECAKQIRYDRAWLAPDRALVCIYLSSRQKYNKKAAGCGKKYKNFMHCANNNKLSF